MLLRCFVTHRLQSPDTSQLTEEHNGFSVPGADVASGDDLQCVEGAGEALLPDVPGQCRVTLHLPLPGSLRSGHCVKGKLTIPFDTVTGVEGARERKMKRYTTLTRDTREKGLTCSLHMQEIGTRGYISPRNRGTLRRNFDFICFIVNGRICTISKH